jgi:hypothetical protein
MPPSMPCSLCGDPTFWSICTVCMNCKNTFPSCPTEYDLSVPNKHGQYFSKFTYSIYIEVPREVPPILAAYIDGQWVWHQLDTVSKYPFVYEIQVTHTNPLIIYKVFCYACFSLHYKIANFHIVYPPKWNTSRP